MNTNRFFTMLLLLGGFAGLIVAWLIPPNLRHPVTPQMTKAANDAQGQIVPPVSQSFAARPHVAIFILPECPCSEDYEPFTHRLFELFGREIEFVGVIAGTQQEADDWKRQHKTPYRIIADPERRISRSYGALRSAYTALVLDGRTLHRLWPGYSTGMLDELSTLLSAHTRGVYQKGHFEQAPATLVSGCILDH